MPRRSRFVALSNDLSNLECEKNMTYQEFMSKLETYNEYYQTGLKKKANSYLKDFLADFSRNVDEKEQMEIIHQLCREICDSQERHWLLERGHGTMPYELHEQVKEKLYMECQENKMPQLRWFYQLFRNDRKYCQKAFDILDRAYNHALCDDKTVLLYFNSWIDILDYGAHHFPDGCCVTKEGYQEAIAKCEQIIAEKTVSERQLEDLEFFKRLYTSWENYLADDRAKDFEDYCKEQQISYVTGNVYYYDKR